MIKINPAVLVLADGNIYKGWSCGKLNTIFGEVVFNTGMTGYQEILTDPSYCNQIIIFTYPELGNTGINSNDMEASQSFVKGIGIKNLCKLPSNFRTEQSLVNYLELHNIMCIYGLDTRLLTKHLRKFGSMHGVISSEIMDTQALLQKLKSISLINRVDLVSLVTTPRVYSYSQSFKGQWYSQSLLNNYMQISMRVVVIDFGVKNNILRRLQNLNCTVIVVPADTNFNTILSYKPHGVLLSNGPGDPVTVTYGVKTIRQLLCYSIPIFGICMGHQLLSIALGYGTYKLKFGHRGLNHPIGWSNKVNITSQNHGFAVHNNLPMNMPIQMRHINFSDNTIAGISHCVLPVFSVQYHPEASPGPHDSDYLFAYFISVMYQHNFNRQKD